MGFLVVGQDVGAEKRREYCALGAIGAFNGDRIENDIQVVAGSVLRPTSWISREQQQGVLLGGLRSVVGPNGDPVALHL